jgi:predicted CXXCH cytochrome family protein
MSGSLLLLGCAVGWTFWQLRRALPAGGVSAKERAGQWPQTPWKNARRGIKYLGDEACARCHADVAETFRRHPMGRSLAPIASAPNLSNDQSDRTTSFEAGQSLFEIERRGGRVVHRETRRDAQGRVLAQVEAEVSYALGSGTKGVSYLVERGGRLFQSPISWFSEKSKWDLSPGYERKNSHFERPIEPQCLFCHSNQVQPVDLSINRYEEPIFRGHAIGCERCHGPGELHARRQDTGSGPDLTIVNPRHLAPSLRAAVCEQCHLLGDQRIERPGRATFDYRPGLPTSEFFAIYDRPSNAGIKAVGHVGQMKVSRCFRESRGGLDCISCHDPHQVPAPQQKIAYFRQRCLNCHDRKGCSLPEPERRAASRGDSCIQCHMPTSDSSDIVHVAITDHRILRTRGDRVTESAPGRAGPVMVLLNGDGLASREIEALGRELGIAMMFEGEGQRDSLQMKQMASHALRLLEQALAQWPDDVVARRAKAQALAILGRREEALRLDAALLRSAPSYEQALAESISCAIELRDSAAALAPARQAVALNPWSAGLHERLAFINLELKDFQPALDEASAALRLNPFLRFARMFLIQCLIHRNELERAGEELRTLSNLYPSEQDSLARWFAAERRRHGN